MNFTNEEEILHTCYKVRKLIIKNVNSRAEIIRPPSIIKRLIKQKADRYRTRPIKTQLQHINIDPNELLLLTKITTEKIQKALPKREIVQEYSYTNFLNKTKKKSEKKKFLKSHGDFHFKRQMNEASNKNSIKKEKNFINKIIKDWDKKISDVEKRTKESVNLKKEEINVNNLSTILNIEGKDDPSNFIYVDSVYRYVLNKINRFERINQPEGFFNLGRSMNSFSYSKVLSRFPQEKFNLLNKLLKNFIMSNEDENIELVLNILKSFLDKIYKGGNFNLNKKEKRLLILEESCSILEKEFFRKVQKCGKIHKLEEAPASLQYILGYINEEVIKPNNYKIIRDEQNFPFYQFILYSLRAGLKNDLIDFLDYGNFREKENILILLRNDQNNSYSFSSAKNHIKCKPQEGYYKYQLSCLFNYNQNQEEDFSLNSTENYLWYHLKKNLYIENNKDLEILPPLLNLQKDIREGQKGEDRFSYKIIIRIYCFLNMFKDLVEEIGLIDFNNNKSQNILFFLLETDFIQDDVFLKNDNIKTNYLNFIDGISKNEPVKAFSYFKCIKNNKLRQDMIIKFMISNNNLLEKFFNIGTESKRYLLDLKNLLENDYKNILNGIADKKYKEQPCKIWMIRIYEELQLVNILLENIIVVNSDIIKHEIKNNGSQQTEALDKFNYLCKIFIENKDSPIWANDPNFNSAVKSNEIKKVFLSTKKDSIKRTLEIIDECRIFEYNITDEDDLIYLMYLEICKLSLKLLRKEFNTKRRSYFSSDSKINRIKKRLEIIREFYDEYLDESIINEEKGFDLPNNSKKEIKDLIFDLISSFK